MKKTTLKKLTATALTLVMCLSFASCAGGGSEKGTLNMTDMYTCIQKSEKETLNFLDIGESDIEERMEPAKDNVDIILSKELDYNGINAKVKLMFYKDRLVSVNYFFEDEKAALKYAQDICKKFDTVYDTVDGVSFGASISELTEEQIKDAEGKWTNIWVMKDEYNFRKEIARDERDTDLVMDLSLNKTDKSTMISVSIWAGKVTND